MIPHLHHTVFTLKAHKQNLYIIKTTICSDLIRCAIVGYLSSENTGKCARLEYEAYMRSEMYRMKEEGNGWSTILEKFEASSRWMTKNGHSTAVMTDILDQLKRDIAAAPGMLELIFLLG